MKCNYCNYKGTIFNLWKHVMNKSVCNDKYTPEQISELKKIYESHKSEKRKISKATYYQSNKKLKESKVNSFYSVRRVIFFIAFLPIPGN